MGSNGIEPSTSRLSGVRSNHLSYEPIIINWCFEVQFQPLSILSFKKAHSKLNNETNIKYLLLNKINFCSLERRWSSRTFRYGYLVTTSPQSPDPPSTAAPLRLAHRLRVFSTLMAWRAVCTRPENVFTAVCWPAITSNSIFIQSNFRLQSELRQLFGFRSTSRFCFPLYLPL